MEGQLQRENPRERGTHRTRSRWRSARAVSRVSLRLERFCKFAAKGTTYVEVRAGHAKIGLDALDASRGESVAVCEARPGGGQSAAQQARVSRQDAPR